MSGRAFRLNCYEPRESAVLDSVKRALRIHPAVGDFSRTQACDLIIGEGKKKRRIKSCKPGWPDITGYIIDGRALFIEVKRPVSGAPTREQQDFIEAAAKSGAVAFFARSVEDVFQHLDPIFKAIKQT
jgi:hypothetical protein